MFRKNKNIGYFSDVMRRLSSQCARLKRTATCIATLSCNATGLGTLRTAVCWNALHAASLKVGGRGGQASSAGKSMWR